MTEKNARTIERGTWFHFDALSRCLSSSSVSKFTLCLSFQCKKTRITIALWEYIVLPIMSIRWATFNTVYYLFFVAVAVAVAALCLFVHLYVHATWLILNFNDSLLFNHNMCISVCNFYPDVLEKWFECFVWPNFIWVYSSFFFNKKDYVEIIYYFEYFTDWNGFTFFCSSEEK